MQPVEQVWQFRVIFDAHSNDMARQAIEGLCEGVVRANMVWLRAHPEAPSCLGDAGVKYVLPMGCLGAEGPCQTVRGAAEIFAGQVATCIDIACYYAAYLRLRGRRTKVVAVNMVDGSGRPIPGQYHILVETPRGRVDYTQDLIDGDNVRCRADGRRAMSRTPARGW